MTLYERWVRQAYNEKGEINKKVWDVYAPQEKEIYVHLLQNKENSIRGTIKELSKRFDMSEEFICGFIDGINDATTESVKVDELTEDSLISLDFTFEALYKKMVEYKADQLYTLPQWESIFSLEEQKALYTEQKSSKTVVKKSKPGRNDACTCGSGKKYKKCCGVNE